MGEVGWSAIGHDVGEQKRGRVISTPGGGRGEPPGRKPAPTHSSSDPPPFLRPRLEAVDEQVSARRAGRRVRSPGRPEGDSRVRRRSATAGRRVAAESRRSRGRAREAASRPALCWAPCAGSPSGSSGQPRGRPTRPDKPGVPVLRTTARRYLPIRAQTSPDAPLRSACRRQQPAVGKVNPTPHSSPGRCQVEPSCR